MNKGKIEWVYHNISYDSQLAMLIISLFLKKNTRRNNFPKHKSDALYIFLLFVLAQFCFQALYSGYKDGR